MNDDDKQFLEFYEIALQESYRQYSALHDFQSSMIHHPMFYNGTVCENNDCTPEDPGPLMSLDEFKKFVNNNIDHKWYYVTEGVLHYIHKTEYLDKKNPSS